MESLSSSTSIVAASLRGTQAVGGVFIPLGTVWWLTALALSISLAFGLLAFRRAHELYPGTYRTAQCMWWPLALILIAWVTLRDGASSWTNESMAGFFSWPFRWETSWEAVLRLGLSFLLLLLTIGAIVCVCWIVRHTYRTRRISQAGLLVASLLVLAQRFDASGAVFIANEVWHWWMLGCVCAVGCDAALAANPRAARPSLSRQFIWLYPGDGRDQVVGPSTLAVAVVERSSDRHSRSVPG